MLKEARRLRTQWKLSVSFARRSAIAKQLMAINLLLGLDNEQNLGRYIDE